MTTNPESREINNNPAELQKSVETEKTKPILDQNNNENAKSKMADTKSINTESLPEAQVEASGDVETQMKKVDDLKITDATEQNYANDDQKSNAVETESGRSKSEDLKPETTENKQPEETKPKTSDDAESETPKLENQISEDLKSEDPKFEDTKFEEAKSDKNSDAKSDAKPETHCLDESDKKDDSTAKPLLTNAKLPQYAPNYHTRPQNQHFHQPQAVHHQHFANQNSAHTQLPQQFHHSHQTGHQQHHHHHHNHAFSRSDKTTVRFLIPAKAAGAIIGKGGANIKELREKYQALIAIPDAATPERVVRIQLQDTQKMIEVVQKISELLKDDILKFRRSKNSSQSGGAGGGSSSTNNQVNHPFNGEDNTEMRMLVHQSQAGAIIGPKGSHVKRINEETGAKINVQTEICPHSTDKVAQITGTPDAISKAVGQILILFQNFPPKGNQFFYDPNYHDPSYEYGGYGFTGQMNPFSHYPPHQGQFPHHHAPHLSSAIFQGHHHNMPAPASLTPVSTATSLHQSSINLSTTVNNNPNSNNPNSNNPNLNSTAPTAIYHQPSAVAAAVQAAATASSATTSQSSPPANGPALMHTPGHPYFQMPFGQAPSGFLPPHMYMAGNFQQKQQQVSVDDKSGEGENKSDDKPKSHQAPLLQHNMYFPYATPYVQPGYFMHPQFYHSYRPQQAQLSAAAQPFVMKPGQMMQQQMPMMNQVQNPNIQNSSVAEKKGVMSTDSKLPMSNKEIYEKRQQKTPTPEKKVLEEK